MRGPLPDPGGCGGQRCDRAPPQRGHSARLPRLRRARHAGLRGAPCEQPGRRQDPSPWGFLPRAALVFSCCALMILLRVRDSLHALILAHTPPVSWLFQPDTQAGAGCEPGFLGDSDHAAMVPRAQSFALAWKSVCVPRDNRKPAPSQAPTRSPVQGRVLTSRAGSGASPAPDMGGPITPVAAWKASSPTGPELTGPRGCLVAGGGLEWCSWGPGGPPRLEVCSPGGPGL